MSTRITYLINQYPKVSHSFIRREILALERVGIEVQRIALRGWETEPVDAEDAAEQKRTKYILKSSISPILPLLLSTIKALLSRPLRFVTALMLAVRMSRHSDRSLPFHLTYLAEACRMLPWLVSFGTRHVHAHFGTNSTEVVMLAQALGGLSYSFTVHGPEEFDKPQFIGLREKVRRASFVVAISSFGRSQIYRWVEHHHWAKIQVVHCGLEAAFHDVVQRPPSAIARLVCVGRLCEQKGQLLLLEAAALLIKQGIRFELVLAGDGEMRGEIEELILHYGLEQCVRITGWISGAEVRAEILASRALVLPSFAEGLPVVIMEAMALRRPVLTTIVAGIPELVRHAQDGWLFPAGSVEELASAMTACIATAEDRLKEMGQAAHERVLERHSIDTEAGKLAAHFRTAIEIATA